MIVYKPTAFSDGILKPMEWTDATYAWPREVCGVRLNGVVRRFNPITKKNYLESGWPGRLERYMFRNVTQNDKIVPDNFEELLLKPKIDPDATIYEVCSDEDVHGQDIKITIGTDSQGETPFDDGELVNHKERVFINC